VVSLVVSFLAPDNRIEMEEGRQALFLAFVTA